MKILATIIFLIILSGCSTHIQERTFNVDASLMQPCPPLTLINGSISLGEMMLLSVEDYGLYNECRQSKQGLIDSINEYNKR